MAGAVGGFHISALANVVPKLPVQFIPPPFVVWDKEEMCRADEVFEVKKRRVKGKNDNFTAEIFERNVKAFNYYLVFRIW